MLLLSLCGRKQIRVSDQVDTSRPVKSQKIVRSLKFRMKEEEGLYYHVAKTKALISFAVTAKLVCAYVFAYADCLFSYAVPLLFWCCTVG